MQSLKSRSIADLRRLSKPWVLSLALVLAVLVGEWDYITGYDFHVTAFYVVPICWACWAGGRKVGIVLAIACAAIFAVANIASGQGHADPMITVWNALMLLSLFLVAVYSLTGFLDAYSSLAEARSSLQIANERLEETVQRRTAALTAEIAERERVEQAKVAAERLLERQEKLAVLGTLTAGIAHEIRNPLTSLKARLYTLEKHMQDVPAARKDTEIIGSEISRLERIVQDVLSFARPANPRLESLAVDTLLREVHGLMASNLASQRVQLVVEPGSGLFIRADSGHMKQVLVNLIRNAADAVDDSGVVILRSRSARAHLAGRETDAVILEVCDTGKGIPPEVEKRLFDPFFSTKDSGTGLGLSIAARIVERQGGVIQHRTQLGRGTIFSVVLPREINEAGAVANADVS